MAFAVRKDIKNNSQITSITIIYTIDDECSLSSTASNQRSMWRMFLAIITRICILQPFDSIFTTITNWECHPTPWPRLKHRGVCGHWWNSIDQKKNRYSLPFFAGPPSRATASERPSPLCSEPAWKWNSFSYCCHYLPLSKLWWPQVLLSHLTYED